MIEFTIILPIHNEAEIIETTFREIYTKVRRATSSCEFILVENGSTDNTYHILKKISKLYQNVRLLTAPKGYGSAVLKGLNCARGKYVCYMPSDGQIDMEVFPTLIKELKSGKWNLVKIKRINRENLTRTIVSIVFSKVISLLFKTPTIDVNGSPRILEKKHLKSLNLKSQDSFLDAEFLIKISRLGWKIKEVPMKNLPRTGGKSTRSINTFLEFFKNIYKFRFNKF